MDIILLVMFIGIPVAVIIFFIVSLFEFKRTPKDCLYYKKRKTKLIVSVVIMGIVVTSAVLMVILSMMIIRNM